MEMGNNSQQNFKWIVYCVICTENDKIYIGVHKTLTPYKFDRYIGGGWEIGTMIKNPITAYENALKKYGYSKFRRIVLKVFDNSNEAYELEKYLVDMDFVKRRDTYNTSIGGVGGTMFKKFYQYDLNGNFIKEWDSRESLIKYYNMQNDVNRIHRAVVNKWTAFDSYWTEEKFDKLNLEEFRNSKFSYIYQYDIDCNLIAKYNTAIDAANALKTTMNVINEAVSKKISVKNYFFTKNPINIINIIKTYQDRLNKLTDKCVSIYNLDKTLVKTFKCIKDVAKYLNIQPNLIKEAIKSGKEINNFLISYGFNDIYSKNTIPGLKVNQYDLDGNFIKQWPTIASCTKEHPKVRLVLTGIRKHTHNYTFKIAD